MPFNKASALRKMKNQEAQDENFSSLGRKTLGAECETNEAQKLNIVAVHRDERSEKRQGRPVPAFSLPPSAILIPFLMK